MCALVCVCVCVSFSADFHPYSINLTKKQATNIYIERIHHLLFCCSDVSRMAFFMRMASIWFRLMMNNLGLKKACVFRKMDRICQRQWRNLCIRFVEFAVGCEQPKSHLHTLCASSYGVRLFNATKNQWIPFEIFKLSNMCNQSESEIHIEKYQSFDKWKVSIIREKFTGQHYVTWHFRHGSIFGFSFCWSTFKWIRDVIVRES